MKKQSLATLAAIGISAGLLMTGCEKDRAHRRPGESNNKATAAEQLNPDVQSFYDSLSPQAQRKFMEMDAQHRMMAMEMADQSCNGKNNCKGMGGCSTADHACAGKNSCKGQGGAPVNDANKAVEIQYKHMQRHNMNDGGVRNRNVNVNDDSSLDESAKTKGLKKGTSTLKGNNSGASNLNNRGYSGSGNNANPNTGSGTAGSSSSNR